MEIIRSPAGSMNRLSLFCDVSGRLCKESHRDKSFTVGGIVVPTADEKRVRAHIVQKTPKWADSNANSIAVVENILTTYSSIYCTVVRIHKTEPAWTKFWDDGEARYRKLSPEIRRASKDTKPSNILQGWAIRKCYSIALGSSMYLRGRPTVLGPDGLSILYLRITCDTDIKGKHNQEAFENAWRVWHKCTGLPVTFRIRPEVESIAFRTEQSEPLLILPDYLAGYCQCSSDETGRVSRPGKLSHQDMSYFGEVLSRLEQSGRLTSVEHAFAEEFPSLGLR